MLEIKQSIDLYSEEFRPAKLPEPVRQLLMVLGAVVAINFLVGIILLATDQYAQYHLANSEAEQTRLNQELSDLIAQMPNRTVDRKLEQQLKREKLMVNKREKVIKFLQQDSVFDTEGYTDIVAQLANQNVSGIWLKRFSILDGGKNVELQGIVNKPSLVSRYLQQLGTQSAYQGRAFRQININAAEQGKWSHFFISTKEAEKDPSLIDAKISRAGL